MTYPVKIDVVDAYNQKIYSTKYNFIKTSIINEIVTKLESTSTLNSITISWESVPSFSNFYAQSQNENFFYITYQGLNTKICNHTILENEKQINDTLKFKKYFLNDPNNRNINFKTLAYKLVDGTKNFINITDLKNSTCYRFDIYPCRKANILMCSTKVVHLKETLVPIEHLYMTKKLIGFLTFGLFFTLLLTFWFYKFGFRTKNGTETHIELQNQGGVIDVDQWELEREKIVQIKVLGN